MTLAQIGAIIALLYAFGVQQSTIDTVQGILNATQTSQVQTQMSVPNTGGAVIASSPTCIENLTLTTKWIIKEYAVEGKYTNTCGIDMSTKWKFRNPALNTGDCNAFDEGTFGKHGCYMHGWDIVDANTIFFEGNVGLLGQTYVLQVGDLTATTTVPTGNQ